MYLDIYIHIFYNTCTCTVKSINSIVDQIYVENYSEMYIISYTRYRYLHGRIYYEANEASASGPHQCT